MREGIKHLQPWVAGFRIFATLLLSALVLGGVRNSFAVDGVSPYAMSRGIDCQELEWTHGFWKDRFELVKNKTIPALRAIMEGTNYSQFLRNFQIAAGIEKGEYRGAPFNDGEFYKFIEAESVLYSKTHDKEVGIGIESAIEVIARAQGADGYIHTKNLIKMRKDKTTGEPFHDPTDFETYDMGHLLSAACAHFRATGRTNFLAVATKCGDFLCQSLGKNDPDMCRFTVCPSHYMGLIDLFRATGNVKYLDLVRHLIEMRSKFTEGTDDNQDRVAFDKQTNAVGHAVRANYLYAGVADYCIESGDSGSLAILQTLWTNVVEQQMYLTGGCGALFDGASPDGAQDQKSISRVHQAYGRNYQLPNITAHNETCANIGNFMWNWRMFLNTGRAQYVDIAELALYNSVLSGLSLDGTNFFYVNPLKHLERMPVELRWSRMRTPFISSFCCPPNLARTIIELGSCAYSLNTNSVWVNLYGASRLKALLPGGRQIELLQETDYPWNGRIQIQVISVNSGLLNFHFRIPGWCNSATLRINGQPPDPVNKISSYGYIELNREWRTGDVISLDLDMPTVLIEPNPLVEEDVNQLAVRRGPVVYCAESADLPKGGNLVDVILPQDAALVARYDRNLLGGVTVIDAKAMMRMHEKWNATTLYREVRPSSFKPFNLHLIPYSVWGNRGNHEMSVWLPRAD